MKAMIAAKQAGEEIAEVSHPKMAPVIDLMEALKKSIAEKSQPAAKKPPIRAVPAAASRQQEQAQTAKRKRSTG